MYKRMKLAGVFLLLFLMSIFLVSCDKRDEAGDKVKKTHTVENFLAMDTIMTIELYGKHSKEAFEEIKQKILDIEKLADTKDENSVLSRLNTKKEVEADADTLNMFKAALDYAKKTDGALDISTYSAGSAWGFGKDSYRIPTNEELTQLKNGIDYSKIEIEGNTIRIPDNMQVGLGAVAKGYSADLAIDIAKRYELDYALINLGGNIACFGKPLDDECFRIGIENPKETGTALLAVQTRDKSLVTSGNYQRFFEENGIRYHHIIDPKTASPVVTDVNLVTVVCDRSVDADCLSTSLYVLGEEGTIEFWRKNKEFIDFIMVKDDEIICSIGLKDKIQNLSDLDIVWINE